MDSNSCLVFSMLFALMSGFLVGLSTGDTQLGAAVTMGLLSIIFAIGVLVLGGENSNKDTAGGQVGP